MNVNLKNANLRRLAVTLDHLEGIESVDEGYANKQYWKLHARLTNAVERTVEGIDLTQYIDTLEKEAHYLLERIL